MHPDIKTKKERKYLFYGIIFFHCYQGTLDFITVSNVIAEFIVQIMKKAHYWINFPDEEFETEKAAWQE